MTRSYLAETMLGVECRYTNKLTFSHTHGYNRKIEDEIKKYLTLIGIRDSALIQKMLTIQ
jgi:hypothetical protein